jgi:hypothetical protein
MEQRGRIGAGRWIARTLEDRWEKRQKVDEGRGTKQIEGIRKSPKVAERQRSLKDLEEGGRNLKTVEEIPSRWMNRFDRTIRSRKVTRAGGKSKKLEKESGNGRRQPGDEPKKDQLMANGSKYHWTEANIYSIEWRTGGEARGCSNLEGRRIQKVEAAIGRKKSWSRSVGKPSDH